MKIYIIALFLFVIGSQSAKAQMPAWKWAVQSDGPKTSNAFPESMCTDREGNIYVAAIFDDTITIGDSVFQTEGMDLLLLKYDSDGKILWIRHPIGGGMGETTIALDSEGNCYVGAEASNLVDFGNNIVYAFPGAFIAKFDSHGEPLWAEQLLNWNSFSIQALATDKSNNFYLTGLFQGVFDFGGTSFNSDSTSGSLLAKFDSEGKVQWAIQPLHCITRYPDPDSDADYNQYISITSLSLAGNAENISIYASGSMVADTVFYGKKFISGIGVSLPTTQSYLARLNAQGDCEWAVNVDRHQQYYAESSSYSVCAIDKYAYVTGSCTTDSTNFSDTGRNPTFPNTYNAYIFVSKYDALGLLQWTGKISSLAGASGDHDQDDRQNIVMGSNICVDALDNSFLSGNFTGATNFNGYIINSLDSLFLNTEVRNEFVMKFDKNGTTSWVQHSDRSGFGSIVSSECFEALHGENIYVAGNFIEKTVDFGTSHLARNDSGYNSATSFLAKLGGPVIGDNVNQNITPEAFTLYPNPASSQTMIAFTLARPGSVLIEIFDLLGRKMKVLALGELIEGEHSQMLDLRGLPNGAYLCRVTREGTVSSEVFTHLLKTSD